MVAVRRGAENNVAELVVAFLAGQIIKREVLVFLAEQLADKAVDGVGAAHDLERVHAQALGLVFHVDAADAEELRKIRKRDQRGHPAAGDLAVEALRVARTLDREHFLGLAGVFFAHVAVVVNDELKIVLHDG